MGHLIIQHLEVDLLILVIQIHLSILFLNLKILALKFNFSNKMLTTEALFILKVIQLLTSLILMLHYQKYMKDQYIYKKIQMLNLTL